MSRNHIQSQTSSGLRVGKLTTALAALYLGLVTAIAQAALPQSNYLQHCAGCHLVDGSGFPPEVPNLRSDLGYLLNSPEGRDFMLRVPGVVGVPISLEEVKELLNWMVAEYYPEQTDFEPFTVEEIEDGRARPLYDPLRVRKELFPELDL